MTKTKPHHQVRSCTLSIRLSPSERGELVNFAMSYNSNASSLFREICFDVIRLETNQPLPFSISSIIKDLRGLSKLVGKLALEHQEADSRYFNFFY